MTCVQDFEVCIVCGEEYLMEVDCRTGRVEKLSMCACDEEAERINHLLDLYAQADANTEECIEIWLMKLRNGDIQDVLEDMEAWLIGQQAKETWGKKEKEVDYEG